MNYNNNSCDSDQLAAQMSPQDSFPLSESSFSWSPPAQCSFSYLQTSGSFSPVYGAGVGAGLGEDVFEQQQAVVSALAQQFQKSTMAAQTQAMLQLLIPLVNQGSGGLLMKEEDDEKFQKPGNSLYKTEMCRAFEETGVCKYGRKCQYAHGADELRSTLKHPKFKTIACETILKGGVCPYGKRCRFIHPSDTRNYSGSCVVVDRAMGNEEEEEEEHRRLPVFQSLTLKDHFSA